MKKNQHVVPLGNGWAVKGAGNAKATVITTTQSEAIAYAGEVAKSQHSEFIIHGRNGKIRERTAMG